MRPRRVPDAIYAAALGGCVVEPEMLNSDRIEAQFGNYGIDVIDVADRTRRSNLHSTNTDSGRPLKTCRTFSVVCIEDFQGDVVDAEHSLVMRGGSIGAIFKANDWNIYKETLHTGSLSLPHGAETIPALMRVAEGTELAVHIYRLLVNRQDFTLRYATIVEVHHPDYLGRSDLEKAYVTGEPMAMAEDDRLRLMALVLRET